MKDWSLKITFMLLMGVLLVNIGILLVNIFDADTYSTEEQRVRNHPICKPIFTEKVSISEFNCCIDCVELELDYFRYNTGKFGSNSCWCKQNNEVERIW